MLPELAAIAAKGAEELMCWVQNAGKVVVEERCNTACSRLVEKIVKSCISVLVPGS
jgi:hypothetical protein